MNRTWQFAAACIIIASALIAVLPGERRNMQASPASAGAAAQDPAEQRAGSQTANSSSDGSIDTNVYGHAPPVTHRRLALSLNGKPLELTIDAMETGRGTMLLGSVGNGAVIQPWPGHDKEFVAEIDSNLYAVDVASARIEKLLEDESGIYKLQDVEGDILEDSASPVWGANPAISPDSRTLIFFSNRNAAYDRGYNGFMWRKNLDTGEERPILAGGYSVIGWGLSKELFIRRADRIMEVDVSRGTETEIAPFSQIAAVSYPYLINQAEPGKLSVTYLVTGETASYGYPGLNAVRQISPSPYGSWAVLVNQTRRDEAGSAIDLINLCTGEVRRVIKDAAPPAYVSWTADDAFVLYSESEKAGRASGRAGTLVRLEPLLDKPVL